MDIGKAILSVDEDLLPVVAFFGSSGLVDFRPMLMVDKGATHLQLMRVAERAAKTDVESVLISTDNWIAKKDPAQQFNSVDLALPVHLRLDRQSALSVVAATREGAIRDVLVPYSRTQGGIKFSEPDKPEGSLWNSLEPLRIAWHLDGWSMTTHG